MMKLNWKRLAIGRNLQIHLNIHSSAKRFFHCKLSICEIRKIVQILLTTLNAKNAQKSTDVAKQILREYLKTKPIKQKTVKERQRFQQRRKSPIRFLASVNWFHSRSLMYKLCFKFCPIYCISNKTITEFVFFSFNFRVKSRKYTCSQI